MDSVSFAHHWERFGFWVVVEKRESARASLQIPQVAQSEAGFFNSDRVEALTRASHQLLGSLKVKKGQNDLFHLGRSDYEKASELLKGKIEGNGE